VDPASIEEEQSKTNPASALKFRRFEVTAEMRWMLDVFTESVLARLAEAPIHGTTAPYSYSSVVFLTTACCTCTGST